MRHPIPHGLHTKVAVDDPERREGQHLGVAIGFGVNETQDGEIAAGEAIKDFAVFANLLDWRVEYRRIEIRRAAAIGEPDLVHCLGRSEEVVGIAPERPDRREGGCDAEVFGVAASAQDVAPEEVGRAFRDFRPAMTQVRGGDVLSRGFRCFAKALPNPARGDEQHRPGGIGEVFENYERIGGID